MTRHPSTDYPASRGPAGFTAGPVVSAPGLRVSPLDGDAADQGHHPQPSVPAPGSPPSGSQAVGLSGVAVHEAAHAAASVHLLGSVGVVSIRPGRGHLGVTLLGERTADDRETREREIVVGLVGDIAEQVFGLLDDGWTDDATEPDPLEAVATLDRLSPLARDGLLHAEAAAPDDARADGPRATWIARSLNDLDAHVAEAHLAYLRLVAEAFVRRHVHAIRAVAQALLTHTVLDGSQVEELVRGSRCACHGWAAAPPKEIEMPEPRTGPYLPQPLTLDNPHTRIAREGFWCGFWVLPSGHVAQGLTWVREGQLADDRSVLFRRNRDRFRRPTRAERAKKA